MLATILLCSTPLTDDFARRALDAGLLRPKAQRDAERGELWSGPVPKPETSPLDVIKITLHALRNNDEPQPHSGTALLRRFSTDTFLLPGEPSTVQQRLPPQELTKFFEESQYCLFLDPECRETFPSDIVALDDANAWQETCLEDTDGNLLAKLGWTLRRRGSDGCWATDALSWHDFREEFRPGIGEVEWDRSFG